MAPLGALGKRFDDDFAARARRLRGRAPLRGIQVPRALRGLGGVLLLPGPVPNSCG